jgi:hypothetical protein
MRRASALIFAGVLGLGLASLRSNAWAEPPPDATLHAEEQAPAPPPAKGAFIQYGVAFTGEVMASHGPVCTDDPGTPCILGSGGGIAGRVGWRSAAAEWYFGGAYELSKHDPNKLYRLAILQQLRAEARRYFASGRDTQPFVMLGAGVAGYGNEWSIGTWGPTAFFGGGVEIQLKGGPLVNITLGYRPLYLKAFVDSSTLSHDAGIAHFVGFEVAVEARDLL